MTSSLRSAPASGLVSIGGSVDLHGRLFQPTWTRLSSTAYASDTVLYLADSVNGDQGWQPGMEVVVTTSTWDDRSVENGAREQPENERRRIQSVHPNGKSIELDSPLTFRHHGGKEYDSPSGINLLEDMDRGGGVVRSFVRSFAPQYAISILSSLEMVACCHLIYILLMCALLILMVSSL